MTVRTPSTPPEKPPSGALEAFALAVIWWIALICFFVLVNVAA